MQFVDEKTGEIQSLFETVELMAELEAHSVEFDCNHSICELRRRRVEGGATQIRKQCLRCGHATGNAVKRQEEHEAIPAFDESVKLVFEQARKLGRQAICRKHLKLQTDREASHQKKYDKYLASPSWAEKRQKIFKRANGVCEGCLEQEAYQVHHLTYNHIFNEFMFELVALCKYCHEKLHDDKALINDNKIDDNFEPPCCACRWQDHKNEIYWYGKFAVSAISAMADTGPCGPKQSELEGLR